jgi:hypothetical protein
MVTSASHYIALLLAIGVGGILIDVVKELLPNRKKAASSGKSSEIP